jgi:hypothetical protein
MTPTSDYKVSFGRIARTLIYEDSKGTLCFTFDVDTSNGKNTLILERMGKSLIEAEQSRFDLALERAKQYLLSRGHEVEVFGG